MYGETSLPGSLFHDIFFNLSISTDKLETRLQPGFQRLHFSFFSCWDPCVHRESKKKALDSKKSGLVNLIQECFYLNCSRVKFMAGHLHQIIIILLYFLYYIIYYTVHSLKLLYRDVLSALGLVKNKKVVFSKI